MESREKYFFAPQLYIKSGTKDVSFYTKAFGAVLEHSWNNDDGSIHAAELSIQGTLFHLHEQTERLNLYSPEDCDRLSTVIGLFVPDVDAVMNAAINAGATLLSKAKDYEYGYRQGEFKDPFGHIWQIEKKI